MEIYCPTAAGLDVHRRTVVAAIHTPAGQAVRTFGTMTPDLEALAAWLTEQGVTLVAMESTGVYWQPVYTILEEAGLELWVVNAQHIKAVPGRKTDVKDAQWLCQLVRHGLVRPSFIPPKDQRELRELVRYRKTLIRQRADLRNRIQKTLEAGNIKLGTVLSDLLGVSGRAMLAALAAGESDPQVVAALADGRLRASADALAAAVTGRMGAHQRFLLGEQLTQLAELEAQLDRLDAEVTRRLDLPTPDPTAAGAGLSRAEAVTLLDTIPGIGVLTAEVIVAEVGLDLTRFPSDAHLASWAGLCPGQRQSGGKPGSGRIRKGNPHLKEMLVEAASAAAKTKGSQFQRLYQRLAGRRGRKRALVAVAHRLLRVVYRLLSTGEAYQEPVVVEDTQARERARRQACAKLVRLGYEVVLHERLPSNGRAPVEQLLPAAPG